MGNLTGIQQLLESGEGDKAKAHVAGLANNLVQRKVVGAEAVEKPVDKFEPVKDEEGNIVAQRNTTTGKVISDPRAEDTTTSSSSIERRIDRKLELQFTENRSPEEEAEFQELERSLRSNRISFVKNAQGGMNVVDAGGLVIAAVDADGNPVQTLSGRS